MTSTASGRAGDIPIFAGDTFTSSLAAVEKMSQSGSVGVVDCIIVGCALLSFAL
jgi:hypothetical protein